MSRVPYALISDTHNHPWSQFAETTSLGVNSRLQIILDETYRAAQTLKALGGKTLIHAGDLFHVRGKIAPSVLNPTKDLYKRLIDEGFDVIILAGNHDLEGKESTRTGSAVTALEDIGCRIINEPTIIDLGPNHRVCMVPWIDKIAALKVEIEKIGAECHRTATGGTDCDLVIHAPVDGVIIGLPDHGLTPAWLAGLGFAKVFSGHYHNHKALGGEVYSIGALTHHTWGDVGSKAGFLTVNDAGLVKYNSQRAPEFITVDASTDPADIPMIVPGNYVKIKIDTAKSSEINAVRAMLMGHGAVGVIVLSQKAPAVASRTGSTIKAGMSLEGSVASWIAAASMKRQPELNALCADILSTVKSAES
jgi:DNA repair exonuclease SbcCD nuclease subunit